MGGDDIGRGTRYDHGGCRSILGRAERGPRFDITNATDRARRTHLSGQQREILARLFTQPAIPETVTVLRRGGAERRVVRGAARNRQFSSATGWDQTTTTLVSARATSLARASSWDVFVPLSGHRHRGFRAVCSGSIRPGRVERGSAGDSGGDHRHGCCRQLVSLSGSLQDQSRRRIDDYFETTPPLGGSRCRPRCCVRVTATWQTLLAPSPIAMGSHGIHLP